MFKLLPDNLRQVITTLVPSGIVMEMCCFVMYDNHPQDDKKLDIIICTFRGELREYYKREVVCTTCFSEHGTPSEVKLYRNGKGDLFYIVHVTDKILIYSRKDTVQLKEQINNVESYDIDDPSCTGQACLKVILSDDAVPVYYDENLNVLSNSISKVSNEGIPTVLTHLMSKFTQAKYSVKYNEKEYYRMSTLRQMATFNMYQDSMPDNDLALFVDERMVNMKRGQDSLKIKTQKPWVKACNQKIVIVLEVFNGNSIPITDVHILLQSSSKTAISYTTRLFRKISELPYWSETTQTINPNDVNVIVAVIDQKELNYITSSSIELSGTLVYKLNDKEKLLQMQVIKISASETMEEDFNILSYTTSDMSQIRNNLLALFASTQKTDLILRHIKEEDCQNFDIMDAFCEFLHMERIPATHDFVIRRGSPCHRLNGIMIVRNGGVLDVGKWNISVHARDPSQVLALIHYIHDAIPYRIVATTTNERLIARDEKYSQHNETLLSSPAPNYRNHATSVVKQIGRILDYLDDCMIKMNESRDPIVQSRIGREIDLYAPGAQAFMKFRQELLDVGLEGVKSVEAPCDEGMEVSINID